MNNAAKAKQELKVIMFIPINAHNANISELLTFKVFDPDKLCVCVVC